MRPMRPLCAGGPAEMNLFYGIDPVLQSFTGNAALGEPLTSTALA